MVNPTTTRISIFRTADDTRLSKVTTATSLAVVLSARQDGLGRQPGRRERWSR